MDSAQDAVWANSKGMTLNVNSVTGSGTIGRLGSTFTLNNTGVINSAGGAGLTIGGNVVNTGANSILTATSAPVTIILALYNLQTMSRVKLTVL